MPDQQTPAPTTRVVVTSQSLAESYTAQSSEPTEKPESTDVPSAEQAPAASKKKPLIDELVRTRHERNAERDRNAQLEAEVERLRQQQAVSQTQAEIKADPRPGRGQFVSDSDYQEALTDWKVDQRLAQQREADQAARAQAAQQNLAEQWERNLTQAKLELQDFDDVVGNSEINLPNHLYTAIIESEIGPHLAYYLAQNPEECKKLMAMTPTTALRILGKLEDRLETDGDTAKPGAASPKPNDKTPEKSKAPEPINPLKNASSPVVKSSEQMTYQEYKAHRLAQQSASRRR